MDPLIKSQRVSSPQPVRSTRRGTGLFQRVRRAKASIVESELAIRVKFENRVVSTEKNCAPAAWLARQTSASVIASPWH